MVVVDEKQAAAHRLQPARPLRRDIVGAYG